MLIRSRAYLCALALLVSSLPLFAANPPPPAPAGNIGPPVETYTVKPGDVLSISVWKEPDLQGQAVLVRPDGTFSFPLAGQIDARGHSVLELQQTLTERLKKYISDPVVTVSIAEVKGNKVYVLGQVNKPG